MRLATANIWGLPTPLSWPPRHARFPRVRRFLEGALADALDVVALQEHWRIPGRPRALDDLELIVPARHEGHSGLALQTRHRVLERVHANFRNRAAHPLEKLFSSKGWQRVALDVDGARVDVINTHLEKSDYPLYDVDYEAGTVTFDSALPDIHTGDKAKAIHNSSYSAIVVELKKCSDFVMPENTHSVSSEQVYNSTIGSSSSSLGQGAFTQRLEDGVNDSVVTFKDQILWFKFFPDRNKTAYTLTQGKLGISRTFPAGAQIQAACTISAESEGTEHSA